MKNGNERREAGLRNQLPLIPVVQIMVYGDQGIWVHVKAFFWLDTLTIMGYIMILSGFPVAHTRVFVFENRYSVVQTLNYNTLSFTHLEQNS